MFIGSLTGGGAERVTVALSRYLIDRGYEVSLVTMHSSERDFYAVDQRLRRVSLGLTGTRRGIGKVFANLERLRALRRVVKEHQADVVIGMMTTESVLAILACAGLPAKAIVSERNFPGRKAVARPWAILRRLCYRWAGAHVAQTREAARWLEENTAARNVTIVANSVAWPVPSVPPRVDPASLVNADRRLVLAVGTKPGQKGFDLLIAAFAAVAVGNPDWDLAIVGPGAGAEAGRAVAALADQTVALGVGHRVHFPGRVGNVGDWYERADLFVLSSRYEGFPNVLLEAMAAGMASIAFDCDTGPRDIIHQGIDGVLVPAENVAALSDAMERLMRDAGERERLGHAATAVRERFSEEKLLGSWREIIDRTSGAPSGTSA